MSMDIFLHVNVAKIQADIDEAQAELDKLKTRAQIDTDKTVTDSTEKLAKVEAQREKVQTSVITTVRRTTQVGLSMAQAFGFAIDQSLQMTVEATMLSIETIAKIQAAESISGVGWATVIPNALAISAMSVTVILLQQQRREAAQRMAYAVAGFRLLAF